MSELSTFRDHARRMAEAEHRPECPPRDQHRRWINVFDERGVIGEGCYDPPRCPGCVSDTDRALWARLADEVDAYLTHDEDEVLL